MLTYEGSESTTSK